MSKTKIFLSVFTMALGVASFIFGGYDDSPGLQLIGAVITISGLVTLIRGKKYAK